MISKTRLWLFAAMALLQLAAPAGMILSRERTLAQGEAFKFQTAPVDPYDAFRGRYVALRIANSEAALAQGESASYGKTVYATIETGADGFAKFGVASLSPPKDKPYLKVKAGFTNDKGGIALQLPFDRFYMEEAKAPAAEIAYREHNRGAAQDAYVVLRVLDGAGVIEIFLSAGSPSLLSWAGRNLKARLNAFFSKKPPRTFWERARNSAPPPFRREGAIQRALMVS